jgi:hypothetical protein
MVDFVCLPVTKNVDEGGKAYQLVRVILSKACFNQTNSGYKTTG